VGGDPIRWDELAPTLSEAAGAVALSEVALDRALAKRCESGAIVIGPAQVEAERAALALALAEEARADADRGEDLLARVRASRGLGPVRFEALLRRNAMLRALVRGEVVVSEEQVALEGRIASGPRCTIRVLTTPSQAVAASARSAALSGDAGSRGARFGERAARESTDQASAARGGLIEGVSPLDPAVPAPIREALATLAVGDVSSVLGLDKGFAVVLLESRGAPDERAPSREALAARVRARMERLAMDRLAGQVAASDGAVTVLDPSLAWSWQRASRGER
jgi:hypothetical protein